MKLPRRTLTEDAVDGYNHTWGVMLLLAVSASTWLLPQLPYVQHSLTEDASMNRYTANCWNGGQLSGAQVAYAHSTCATAFSRALQNIDEVSTEYLKAARIYSKVGSPENDIFRPKMTEETGRAQDNTQPAMSRIYSRIPVITFVLAVCLQLPYLIWTLLSSFSEAGFSQILESVQAAQFADAGNRKQEIFQAINSCKKQQSISGTVLYLFFKILTIAVPIGGFCVVKSQLASTSPMFDYSNTVLFCELPVVQMQNVARHTLQCVFTADNDFLFVRLYDSLHIILAFYFALLATVNIVNFIVWVIKLAPGPFRNRTFSNNKLPLDVYLLLYMARQNVGFLAARNLERGFSCEFPDGEKPGEELRRLAE